ncbi:MAG: PilW family protein [Leptothrix sp. (in: b-proteobacteria)]
MAHRTSRGLGLVEILVAIALGLFVTASVATLVVSQLNEQRLLLQEARLGQDLRATVDLIARDLKRAGHWGSAERGIWSGQSGAPPANPYAGLHPAAGTAATTAATSLGYRYSRDVSENQVADSNEAFGFRINANTNAFELRLAGNAVVPGTGDQWQALTDPALLRITRWQVQHELRSVSLLSHCAEPTCPASSTTCPPVWQRHVVRIDLEARDARDASVRRSLATEVLLRNDEVSGSCPGT